MPFSVSLTFTPGFVLKVVGMRATRTSQQHRNISAAGKEGQEHQQNSCLCKSNRRQQYCEERLERKKLKKMYKYNITEILCSGGEV